MPAVKGGSTDYSLRAIRAFGSADGLPYKTPAYNDAGISLWYRRGAAGTKTAITPATQTAGGAHADGGFVHIGDGWCRLDLPDAALLGSTDQVIVGGSADDWELVVEPIAIVSYDPASDFTTARVEALDNLDAAISGLPSAAAIATAVWASGTRTLTSFGTLAADTATAVWAAGTRTLTGFGTLVADIWAGITTAAREAVADTVWDELLSGHAVSGSTGEALSAATAPSASTVATAVWANLTRTLTSSGALSQDDIDSIVAAITAAAQAGSVTTDGSTLTRHRGDTWSISITGLGDISDRDKLWFTIKVNAADADAKAVLQVEESAGLIYINGGAATVSGNATLTVDDESAGDITITVEAAETKKIGPLTAAVYDAQVLRTDDDVDTLTRAAFVITADVTHATS